jgi:surface-anchored protein
MKLKKASNHILQTICLLGFLGFHTPSQLLATTTISSGHADIFEAEYLTADEGTGQPLTKPEIHLGVHTDSGHSEPLDVLLEIGNSAFRSTSSFSSSVISILGSNAWILPADLEEAASLGLIEAGVAKAGFPDLGPVTFTMVASGVANPGNFALFNSSSAIRLSATGPEVGTSSFSITTGHIHYNWGFSAPGIYTFDIKATYTDGVFGALESAVQTYTFNVIPEPTCGTLLLTAFSMGMSLRRRFFRS